MTKKSMLYLGAGILLSLYLVFMPICTTAMMTGVFQFSNFKLYFFQMDWNSMIWHGAMALTALICFAKAFADELVPDIALVGLFGLLTLSKGITFLMNFINMIKYHQLNTWMAWLDVFLQLFPIMAFGGMAGIMLLKDAFGGLYFAPAAIKVVELVLVLIFANFIPMIGVTAVNLILNALFIGGLFILGKAFTDN